MFGGVPIKYDTNVLADTDERLFPESRNRSARVYKKLVKRHGGEFRKVGAIFKTPMGIIAHPSLRVQIEAALSQ